jgi:F-type H+-transporting ATPase subunit b
VLIDWFTVIAQIINFVILVVLLKIFLYDRVIEAIDRRREEAGEAFDEADRKQEAADHEREKLRGKRQELEDRRKELLDEAREDADRKRQELTEQARSEVNEKKQRWADSLEQRKGQFIDDLRGRLMYRVGQTTRRALKDLADADLERQVVKVFLHRLTEADDDRRNEIRKSAGEEATLTVHTAWDLPEDARGEVRDKLRETLGGGEQNGMDVEFVVDKDVVCGMELRTDGHAVGWNVSEYIQEVTREIWRMLEEETSAAQDEEQQSRQEETQHSGQQEQEQEKS